MGNHTVSQLAHSGHHGLRGAAQGNRNTAHSGALWLCTANRFVEYLVLWFCKANHLSHPMSEHVSPQLVCVSELLLHKQKASMEGEDCKITGTEVHLQSLARISLLTPIKLMGPSTRRYSVCCPGLGSFGYFCPEGPSGAILNHFKSKSKKWNVSTGRGVGGGGEWKIKGEKSFWISPMNSAKQTQ